MTYYVMICDIDNCFMDSREWFKMVPPAAEDREGWDEYIKHDDLCKPNKQVIDLVCCTAELLPVFFVTGREDRKENRHNTIMQIKEYSRGIIDMTKLSCPHKLLMRNEFDYRPSPKVKEEILIQMVRAGFSPLVAIDDEPENCKMFLKYGVPTILYDIEAGAFHKFGELYVSEIYGNGNEISGT